MLRRIFLILMMCAIPFQITWAMAGAYCEHESGKAAQHFGHHDHVHTAPDQDKSGSKGKLDLDCSFHMHATLQGVTTEGMYIYVAMEGAVLNASGASFHHHSVLDRPERPNWFATV
jgi:hypothetical protein